MSPLKIMIVDDDEKILYSFQTLLSRDGFSTIMARRGDEALQKLAEEKPCVIFLDVMMPGMSGLEVLRRLHESGCPGKIILISGFTDQLNENRARELGAFALLIKPLSLRDIRKTIAEALAGNGMVNAPN